MNYYAYDKPAIDQLQQDRADLLAALIHLTHTFEQEVKDAGEWKRYKDARALIARMEG